MPPSVLIASCSKVTHVLILEGPLANVDLVCEADRAAVITTAGKMAYFKSFVRGT